MKTLKDIFVTYEIAQKLKEIGFDEPCTFYYNSNKEFMMQTDEENNEEKCDYNKDEDLVFSPTYTQVENWFIKQGEYDIIVENNKEEHILKLIEKYRDKRMKEGLFKVGDKVFDIRYGWGEVIDVYSKPYCEDVMTKVSFELRDETYFNDGRNYRDDKNPVLSLTEYTIEGFSQRKTINYEDYIGKWGKFWDNVQPETFIIGKLSKIRYGLFTCVKEWADFDHFEPLSEEQIKILKLE